MNIQERKEVFLGENLFRNRYGALPEGIKVHCGNCYDVVAVLNSNQELGKTLQGDRKKNLGERKITICGECRDIQSGQISPMVSAEAPSSFRNLEKVSNESFLISPEGVLKDKLGKEVNVDKLAKRVDGAYFCAVS